MVDPGDFGAFLLGDDFSFNIPRFQWLNAQAELNTALPDWAKSGETLQEAYRQMVRVRLFDAKAIALQRTGQLGTYPSSLGQEATAVAAGLCLADEDVFVPYYRDHATQLLRQQNMSDLLTYWGGDERGSAVGAADDMPVCIPIATQCGHAVGIATAIKLRKQQRAVLVTIGDGGSSKGDFLEALNLAGVWKLPVVFVINNNQWAISVSRNFQSAGPCLAQKGIGAGIDAIQLDGNDYIGLHHQFNLALEHARAGKGPRVIETVGYRLSDHTTADDASRYRSADDKQAAWELEPINRLKTYLLQQGWWSDVLEQRWQQQVSEEVDLQVKKYLANPGRSPESMFEHVYQQWPKSLAEQKQQLAIRLSHRQKLQIKEEQGGAANE